MSQQHTPTPWYFGGPSATIRAQGMAIVDIIYDAHGPVGHANGDFIVQAVNSHAELLEALRSMLPLYDQGGKGHACRHCGQPFTEKQTECDNTLLTDGEPSCKVATARAAIAKAEGRE